MQCPLRHAELVSHSTIGESNLAISYSTCPVCRGYWMDSFSANFIKVPPEETASPWPSSHLQAFYCPVCSKLLVRAAGENIPDSVYVYQCPNHHGYFFPTGQLATFKKAQQTKIAYHKLWHIPMPSVASILLGGMVFVILSGGLAITFLNLQQRQTMQSQAKQTLTGNAVYVASDHRSILVTATTGIEATLTLHIPTLNNFTALLTTTDHHMHQLTVPNIPAGTYPYYFTITDAAGKQTQSANFTFTIGP